MSSWYYPDTDMKLKIESVAISYEDDQNLTDAQKAQALSNLGLAANDTTDAIDGGNASS